MDEERDLTQEDQAQELKRRVYIRESQLEGLFRDMFQACTQKSFSNAIFLRSMQMTEINHLYNEIERDVMTYLQLEQTVMDSKKGKIN